MAKNPKQVQEIKLLPKLAIKCIHVYQLIASPWVGNQCRFYPSCSHYAVEAYTHFGFIKGSWLTFRRILKCHPWHKGGIDLLPGVNNEPCCQTHSDLSKNH